MRMPLVLLISGASALIYEVVWSRLLQIIFSTTVYAASTIFSIFLFGFSAGSFIVKKYHHVLSGREIRVLYWTQIFLGIYGIAIIFLINFTSFVYSFLPSWYLLRFFLVLAIIFPPSVIFGAAWPIMMSYGTDGLSKPGRRIGNLYYINSIGSASGALMSGFLLIPMFGFRLTSIIAAALNFFAAIVLFKIEKEKAHGK